MNWPVPAAAGGDFIGADNNEPLTSPTYTAVLDDTGSGTVEVLRAETAVGAPGAPPGMMVDAGADGLVVACADRSAIRITLAHTTAGRLTTDEVPSATQALDCKAPPTWSVREAYTEGPDGRPVSDFADHNLHLVGYTAPVHVTLLREDLQ